MGAGRIAAGDPGHTQETKKPDIKVGFWDAATPVGCGLTIKGIWLGFGRVLLLMCAACKKVGEGGQRILCLDLMSRKPLWCRYR
jgi:hypothetical protein